MTVSRENPLIPRPLLLRFPVRFVTAGTSSSSLHKGGKKSFRPIYVYIAGNLSLTESNRPPHPAQQIPRRVLEAATTNTIQSTEF